MNGVLGSLLPLAIAITISPVPIIAEILLLFTRKPAADAGAYLVGFVVGLAVVLGILVAVADAVDLTHADRATGAGTVQLVLGVALLVAAVRRFHTRPKDGATAPTPKWMDGIVGFTPLKSFGIGALIGAANPKNIVVGIAAAVTIASAGLPVAQSVVAAAVYVVVAVLGVAAPLVVTLALGSRATPILEGWRAWLEQNNATVMAVLLLVFGVVLVGKGVAGI